MKTARIPSPSPQYQEEKIVPKRINETFAVVASILHDRETIKRIAIPVGSVLVVVAVVALFLIPSIKHIIGTLSDMGQKEQELSIVTTKLSILNELSSASIQSKLDQAVLYLPAKKDMPLLLSTLSSLESQSGVQFQSVQTTPGKINDVERTTDEFVTLDFTISGSGTIPSLKTLLSNLKKSPVYLRPVDMQFSRSDEAESGVVNVQVEAYILPAKKLDRAAADLELSNEEKEVLSKL
ncbi:MAG: type 4a pilus biogenesis protein PilO [bacterium]|nr:type 4a pilus biogenesis protein PilO [bacterium]